VSAIFNSYKGNLPANSAATIIQTAAPTWPSIGSPNCQFGKRTYVTDFPEEGLYYLCVNQTATKKGYPVQISIDQKPKYVTVHINPSPAPSPGSTPTGDTDDDGPASTLAPLFAILVAVLGALVL